MTKVYTWERLCRALDRLPTPGTEPAADQARKALALRLAKRLEGDAATLTCDELAHRLDRIEGEGQSTRRHEPDMCKCVTDPKDARAVGHRTDMYLRLIDWGAACVRKGGPS